MVNLVPQLQHCRKEQEGGMFVYRQKNPGKSSWFMALEKRIPHLIWLGFFSHPELCQ